MDEMIRGLIEDRARTWEAAKALLDSQTEDRSLDAEQRQEYERMNEHILKLDARIEELHEQNEQNKHIDELRAKYQTATAPDMRQHQGNESDDQRFRRLIKEQRNIDVDLSMVRPEFNHERNVVELRDLGTYSATAGGNTVPTSFVRSLYEHMIENSAVRQTNVTVLTTASGESLEIPKTTAHGTAVTIVGEGSAILEGDPTFGKTTLGAWKYAGLIQVPSELVQDTGVDLIGYIARDLGRQLGNKSGTDFVTGNGTNKPLGVMTAAGTGVNGTVVSGVSFDELIDLQYSVIEPYASNAFWLMRRATEGYVRKLKDTNGQYLWQPSLVAGVPNTILSRPVVTDPNVAALGSAAVSIAFGDFSAYYIRDVAGIRLERSDDYAFANDLVTWRAALRTDGDLVDLTGAIKTYAGTAA